MLSDSLSIEATPKRSSGSAGATDPVHSSLTLLWSTLLPPRTADRSPRGYRDQDDQEDDHARGPVDGVGELIGNVNPDGREARQQVANSHAVAIRPATFQWTSAPPLSEPGSR